MAAIQWAELSILNSVLEWSNCVLQNAAWKIIALTSSFLLYIVHMLINNPGGLFHAHRTKKKDRTEVQWHHKAIEIARRLENIIQCAKSLPSA